ncbi:MAG: phospho-sugar mutase [Lachnospiraceae bacterium]|nr:phospho-sugar mutase [Lachnospiraceae bacterium]
MDHMDNYNYWLSDPCFDETTKAELRAISGDENEIKERFYRDLEFGTAGLRGIIGAGTNRMNVYTVRKATQGLANYILKQNGADRGVAISYDCRNFSPEFADTAALCLNANGIKAYVFDALRPTPELSFAVRHLGCIAGINITASHNPAEYNGYKVYWEDGAQITPPHDTGIMAEVNAVTDFAAMKTMDKEEAAQKGLYNVIGKDVDDAYISELKKQIKRPDLIEKYAGEIKVVYTPLHGTGNMPVQRILRETGFTNVYVVPEQEKPDGNFPTVSYPNPEADEAFELGLRLAEQVGADIVLATDPDADRLGVRVRDSEGKYHTLTGNMSGCLLGEYTLARIKEGKGLPDDGALIKTIVTTNMADAIAEAYGVRLIECLTGFKYIGQQILGFEKSGKGTYLFGFEESYGCLIGTYARDKDAVIAVTELCEAACYYRSRGMNMWDAMVEMYEKYGYYRDEVESFTMSGIEGLERISNIMQDLRNSHLGEIGGYKVLSSRDYQEGTITDTASGEIRPSGLPKSNVLYYDLEDRAWVCVRPSGTEPKIKFYYGVKAESPEMAETRLKELGKAMRKIAGIV